MKSHLLPCLRLLLATQVVCVGAYAALVFAFAKVAAPESASGSILTDASGQAVGSRQVAQAFTRPEYFWPRPSAVDYNGAGAGGSNKSPTSEVLTERATEMVERLGATTEAPLPPDLAAASGSGLDPHIRLEAARFQLPRIAKARGLGEEKIEALLLEQAGAPGGLFTDTKIVNVLELNLALDALE